MFCPFDKPIISSLWTAVFHLNRNIRLLSWAKKWHEKKKIKLAWHPVLNQNSSIGSFFLRGSGMRAKTELPFICGKLGFRSGHSLVVYNKLWNHIPLFYLPDSSHRWTLSFWRRSLRSGCTVERQFSNVGTPRAQILGISYRYRVKVMA